jgi:hypothetical protein
VQIVHRRERYRNREKEGVMKNDNPEVSPRQQKPLSQDSVVSGRGLEAIMGTRRMNGPESATKSKLKWRRNVPSPYEKSSRTVAILRSPLDQKPRRERKIVSRNAVRHGFFSKWLLIQHRGGKESRGEYDEFYESIYKHYKPANWLEELWVEKIAVWSWRLSRLIRCESGQIDRALAEHSYELQQAKADDLGGPASSGNEEMDAMTDHLFLPEKEELDKLLRYEAMVNRQLNHALAELERLQATPRELGS